MTTATAPDAGFTPAALALLIEMGREHINDIESGIDDGTYDAADNTLLPVKRLALEAAERALRVMEGGGADNAKQLYLVSGRVSGDDDDEAHLIAAEHITEAEQALRDHLREEADEGETIYVITSERIGALIGDSLVVLTPGALL